MKLLATGGGIVLVRALQVLCGVAVMSLVARCLGPEAQGWYGLSLTVIMLVAALLNGGTGLAAVPMLRRGEVTVQRVLAAQGLWIFTVVVLAGLLGGLLWTLPLGDLLRDRLAWDALTAAIALSGIAALIAFEVFFFNLLAGARLLAGPVTNLLRAVVHLSVVAVLQYRGGLNLDGALGAWVGAQLLAALIAARLCVSGSFPNISGQSREPVRLIGVLLRRGWLGQMSAVASQLHLRLDLFLVSWFCGAAETGVYYVAVRVGELLWLLPGALNPVLVYTSADPDAGAERDALTARAVRVSLAATAVCALGLGLLAEPVQHLLFGGRYAGSVPALQALLVGIVAFAPGAVLAGDFIGRGSPQWNTRASVVTAGVNLACAALLIPRFGIVGASWASSIAYTAGAVLMLRRFRRVSDLSWNRILVPRASDLRR